MERVTDSFLGLQNHCRCDCSPEIKRHLLLGRKAMSNLDSLLKSRYVTLLTKVRLVKAMVFPVVTYECESTQEWMLSKSYWRRLLRAPWRARRSNQSILEEISPEYSLEGLMLKLELLYFGTPILWFIGKDPDAGKNWGQEKRESEDEMAGWHHWCKAHELGQTLGDGEGHRGLACCSLWGCEELDMTGKLSNNMLHN